MVLLGNWFHFRFDLRTGSGTVGPSKMNFCTNRIQLFDKYYVGYFVYTKFLFSGKWQRMVLEEFEHTLLGNWFHFRFDARRGREAFPCDGDQGSARPLRAEKGQRQQGNYCL